MEHKGTQTLETTRLILRRAAAEDAEPMFYNWASDSEVTKYMTWPAHESIEVTRSLLEMWTGEYGKDNHYNWMIVLKELGQPIGSISVVDLDDSKESCEIGYCIGRAWWHKGIMSEAVTAVVEYLFEEVGVSRIAARHDVNNPRSSSVMKRCGMQFEGIQYQASQNNQGQCDLCCYALMAFDRK